MSKLWNWMFGWTSESRRRRMFAQSRKLLLRDLERLHPHADQVVDIEGLLNQVESAELIYDGALESGVAGLYHVDQSWPQHPTIQVDLLNWPREGLISFWPPLSKDRPATCLPAHTPREQQAAISFAPSQLPEMIQQASVMSNEAFHSNCSNAIPVPEE